MFLQVAPKIEVQAKNHKETHKKPDKPNKYLSIREKMTNVVLITAKKSAVLGVC